MRPALGGASEGSLLFCPYSFFACLRKVFAGRIWPEKRRLFLRLEVAFSCFAHGHACVRVKEGFLSSASFVSREQPPPSPIKHVGMEAFGRVCCVSVCVGIWHLFFWVCWLVVARGLRSDLLAFVTPPRSFGLTGLSLCWCCLRWTFRSLAAEQNGITKESGEKVRSKNTPLQLCLARSEYPHET